MWFVNRRSGCLYSSIKSSLYFQKGVIFLTKKCSSSFFLKKNYQNVGKLLSTNFTLKGIILYFKRHSPKFFTLRA